MGEYSKSRAAARHVCTGSAEILHNGNLCWGRLGDVSTGGCYIQTVHASTIGAEVRLCLTSAGAMLDIGAKVVWSIPGSGMGLSFILTSPEDEKKTVQFIDRVLAISRDAEMLTKMMQKV